MKFVTEMYIDLLKKSLVDYFYDRSNDAQREVGADWPQRAMTMIGMKRLNNIKFCIDDIVNNGVEGDFIETGVWRGGAVIFMRGILKAYGITNRSVFAADSFEGLPAPNPSKYVNDTGDTHHENKYLAVDVDTVRGNFERYGLLDSQVRFVKGWFRDTLPELSQNKFALLRLDGDMYESTWDALTNLYPALQEGGYIIIDDFNLQGAKKAVIDYRQKFKIESPILYIDGMGVFWRKEKA